MMEIDNYIVSESINICGNCIPDSQNFTKHRETPEEISSARNVEFREEGRVASKLFCKKGTRLKPSSVES